MKQPETALVVSIHDRLLNKAKAEQRAFNEMLQYYAMERFLYRLSQSPHCDRFVLKGGLMLKLWEASFARPTLDIDLLGKLENREDLITKAMEDVCHQSSAPDGMVYDAETIRAEWITEDEHYHGLRIRLQAFLGPSRVMLQLDIGFGDPVLPAPEMINYPSLLDLPTPHLLGYSKESTIAEKLEAMVSLGMLNSRMKDYYDIWYLSRHFSFRADTLTKAIRSTFLYRGTPIPADPIVLSETFALDPTRITLWKAFRNRTQLKDAPDELLAVIKDLRRFLLLVIDHVNNDNEPTLLWNPKENWSDS